MHTTGDGEHVLLEIEDLPHSTASLDQVQIMPGATKSMCVAGLEYLFLCPGTFQLVSPRFGFDVHADCSQWAIHKGVILKA